MSLIGLIRKYTGILAVYCGIMLTVLDGTIVNVALPSMTEYFHVQASATVWIVNAYQLVITMLLLTFAALGDRWGYKPIFITGISLFTLASACCALSPSLHWLVAARVLQGIGAAGAMSVNTALVRMIYPPDKLGRGMGYNAMVVSFSTVAGPTLAGAILSVSSWHWLFLINLPIGVAAVIIGIKYLPTNPTLDRKAEPFDRISAVESAALLWLLVNVMEDFTKHTDWRIVAAECVGIMIIGWFFICRQNKYTHPLLPMDLLRIPLFSMSVCTSILSFCAQMLAIVSLPFLLTDLGKDPLQIGLLISPWPIGVMIAAPIAGRIVERVHGGLLGGIGLSVFAIGVLLLYFMPENCSTWNIVWRMLVCGLGYGTFQTPNNVTLASSAPRNRSGAAGGMQSIARVLGQTFGTTSVAVMFHLFTSNATASRASLLAAAIIGILGAILSSLRLTQHSSYQDHRK